MSYVQLFRLKLDGSQELLVTCVLQDTQVVCQGDAATIQRFEHHGIPNRRSPDRKNLFPKDGMVFLEQLSNVFASGYLNATEIKAGNPPIV